MGEECECGLGAKWLDGRIGSVKAPDGNFGVFEMSEYESLRRCIRILLIVTNAGVKGAISWRICVRQKGWKEW